MNQTNAASHLLKQAAIFFAILFIIGIAGNTSHAQIGTTAAFSGTVQDTTGAVVPGATVTATHLSTGAVHSAMTDGQGRYQIALLPLGEYRVEAAHPGFRSKINTGLVLTVGKNQEVNFTLEIGEVTESVTVEGGAPLVETRSSTVSSLVGSKEVSDLPLNGRSFDQLVALSAGTVLDNQRSANAFRGVNNIYSIGGVRSSGTKLMVDGSEFAGGGGVTTNVNTASGKMLGVDGIQEFAVVTNNADASYGKKAGGQVSIVTRSGTNAFHGSLFEFLRNNALDARNFFSPTTTPLKRNNFGVAIGGPIVHDKTFFFTNYEKLREVRGKASVYAVPNLDARRGIFPGGVVVPVNPASQSLLNFYPLPNGRDFRDGTAEAVVPVKTDIDDNFFIARLDHRISNADSLFGRYLIQTGENVDGTQGIAEFADVFPARDQLATLGYTRIFSPQLLNQATLAFNRGRFFIDTPPLSGVTVPSVMNFIPGEKNGAVIVSGGSLVTAFPILGGGVSATGIDERFVARNVWEFADQVNYTRGPHSFQMGGGVQRIQSNEFEGTRKRGYLLFLSMQNLAQGVPFQFQGPRLGSDGFKSFRETFFDSYVQDSLKLNSRFTLNLGARWEFMTNPTEKHGRFSVWVPAGNQLTGVYPDDVSPVKQLFTDNRSGNFAPRIGFAWDVFGSGHTAIRGGFGLFYTQPQDDFRGQVAGGPPNWKQAVVANPPFPNPAQALTTGGLLQPWGIDRAANISTVIQYNLRIEQTLAPQTVVAVAYVGSHGYHLVRPTDPQIPPPFLNADGRLQIPQSVVNPKLSGSATFEAYDANSFYNSLQIELTKSLSHGLRFKSAFTWSKSLDQGTTPISGPTGVANNDFIATDHRFDTGLSSTHVGRQLVSNWSYDIPSPLNTGAAGVLVQGWQLGGILTIADGSPMSAFVGFPRSHPNNTADRVDLVPGRSNNPVLGGPDKYFDPTAFLLPAPGVLGNVGWGTMIGPGSVSADVVLTKRTALTERFGLLFRAEFFNIANRPNFALPNNNIFLPNGQISGSAGRIQSTVVDSREIQFGLKLTF